MVSGIKAKIIDITLLTGNPKLLKENNEMMKEQFNTYPLSHVMVLGIAVRNGLEHIKKANLKKYMETCVWNWERHADSY